MVRTFNEPDLLTLGNDPRSNPMFVETQWPIATVSLSTWPSQAVFSNQGTLRMHGLPAGFDTSFLIGATLVSICFTENTTSLALEPGVLITVEGGYAHGYGEHVPTTPTAFVPASESRLMTLLGKTVSRAEGTADGTLTLWFGDGQYFRCFDRPHYEAYQIRCGSREIIV